MANNTATTLAAAAYIKSAPSSSSTNHPWNIQQLTVVCVIDTQLGEHLKDRECALEEIKQAVYAVGANFERVQVRGKYRKIIRKDTKIEKKFTKNKILKTYSKEFQSNR